MVARAQAVWQVFLRIEDTDKERSTQDSVNAIFEGMDYEEGPIFQTERFDRYAEVIDKMLEQGDVYRCYRTRNELDEMSETQRANKEKPRYNDKINNHELDDLIVARTDGTPAYNLTVVVDDLDMEMTHVIRGDDHINNTPRQINMITALGKVVPKHARR